MPARFTGLWRHREFMKLWTGQTISLFGSIITRDALPLVAILTLQASSTQIGFLGAAGLAPMLLIGLLAGVTVDRMRRRPILIVADVLRALLLLSVPAAWLLGVLRIEQLYVVAALAGVLTVFFDVAYLSFLPSLVDRDQLTEGNSKLGVSASVAEIGGSAVAGVLVQIVSAPLTLLIDALSFVFSALLLGSIRVDEARPTRSSEKQHIGREIAEGLRALWSHPLLRPLVLSTGTRTLFGSFFGAIYGLYALRELGLSPALLGLLIGSGGIGALLGALVAERWGRRFGPGATITAATIVVGIMALLLVFAPRNVPAAFALLLASQIVGDMALTIGSISEISLRQTVTPTHLLGRTNGSVNVLEGGAATAGLLLGGALGDLIGLRPTVAIAGAGMLLASAWLFRSPVRRLRELPASTI
jgi:Na+/melibiose symporter-like transporter